ncbi:MAG TPA: hypothetical protein VLF63_02270, partial [Patescibacteria group bacterium]|nr:hypothetical protein [Patescibacteria group bacterium]
RTGTKFFADYFGKFKNTVALHEPKPSRILRMWSMAYLDGKVSNDYMEAVLWQKREKLISDIKTGTYIESNPYLLGFAPVLDKVFNQPLVIQIVRDPREYIRSSLNHGNAFGIKLLFNKYVPFWLPNVGKILGLKKSLSTKMKAAGYWKIANAELISSGSKLKHYRRIRFEDLFDETQSELSKIVKIIGIEQKLVKGDQKHTAVNKSRFSSVPGWQKWDSIECNEIDKICNPLMNTLGYGNEKEWQEKLNH